MLDQWGYGVCGACHLQDYDSVLPEKLSRDRNSPGSGMSHITTACPKPSCWTSWRRAGDAVVGRRNAGWTTSKSAVDVPARARTAHKGLLQKTERGSLLNGPSCPPRRPNGWRD